MCTLPPSVYIPRDAFAAAAGLESVLKPIQTSAAVGPPTKPKPKKRRTRPKVVSLGNMAELEDLLNESADQTVDTADDVTEQEVSATAKVELLASLQVRVASENSDDWSSDLTYSRFYFGQ